jgi:heme exporter protein A
MPIWYTARAFLSLHARRNNDNKLVHGGPLADMPAAVTEAAAPRAARLDVRGLHLWRGERHLLRNISFTLQAGELLQLVGQNGVGKTSLLRCVAGLIEPESGEIQWQGVELRRARDEFHRQLAYLGHVNALKPELTALENLHYSVRLHRQVTAARMHEILGRLQVGHCANLPARALSAGQRRRVAIARVILGEAPLWILDEPITNLDSGGIACVEAFMAAHLRAGGSILAAAHQPLLAQHPDVRVLELH